jgi:hypothetical protein
MARPKNGSIAHLLNPSHGVARADKKWSRKHSRTLRKGIGEA